MTVAILRQLPALANIKHTATQVKVTSDPPSANTGSTGTLYVDSARLVFYSDEGRSSGFSIDYPSIVIHAISRDSEDGAHLYCQLDGPFPGTNRLSDDDSDSDDEVFTELRFFPGDTGILDELFNAMSECAALNPDPQTNEDDDDDTCAGQFHDGVPDSQTADDTAVMAIGDFDPSNFITSADQADQLTPEGRAILEHLESVIVVPEEQEEADGRYDDADEDAS